MTRRWTLRLLVGPLAAAAVLTGCATKQAANESLPSTSSAPTTQALPPLGPKDLPMPAEARTKDAAGAEAFVRYYIALINHQQSIPDGHALRDLGPNCADCQRIASRLDQAADAGQRIQGGELSLVGRPGISLSGETAEISFIARVASVRTVDSSGTTVPNSEYKAEGRLPSGAGLVWSADQRSWLASGLTVG